MIYFILRSYPEDFNKNRIGGLGRESITPLVPHLKIVLACLASNTDPICTAQYRSVVIIGSFILIVNLMPHQ